MVDIECIRKLHKVKGLSQREIAEMLNYSRNTVAKYLQTEDLPPRYHLETPRSAPVMDPVKAVVAEWLANDEKAPPKQRHTAKRIYDRLREEYGFTGHESTVRRYVHVLRAVPPEAFIPLGYELGSAAQGDWGEAVVEIDGVMTKVHVFCLRLCASALPFVMCFPHERAEAFFEGHRQAFEFFGGVPHRIIYDNLTTAVKKILLGRNRIIQAGFQALKTHYLFDTTFCRPGKQGAHEKGLVENLVGYARHNFLVPVPKVSSLAELNAVLLERCLAEKERRVGHRKETVGELVTKERECLIPLPPAPFACCRTVSLKVNALSLVQFERCRYSVPTEIVGQTVMLKAFVDHIEIASQERLVATHTRLYEPYTESLKVEHYLPLLAKRPSAVANARVFSHLTGVYQEFRRRCLTAMPPRTRDFLTVLKLHGEFEEAVVTRALEQALFVGTIHADAIRQLCLRQMPGHEAPAPLAAKGLPDLELETPDLGRYNRLLEVVSA